MLRRFLKIFFIPRPTLFDLCVGLFILIPWIKGDSGRSIFIVFYSAFLVCLSMTMRPKRQYKSLPLSLLAIWSLINVFIHSCDLSPYIFHYKNYYLMIEGFLFILFGVLFLTTVVKYSTNIKFVFFLIPVALWPWYKGLVRIGSATPLAALGIAIVLYLFLSKRLRWGIVASLWGITGMVLNWPWLCMKFRCRPYVMGQLLKNMFYHPVRKDAINILDPGIQLSSFLQKFLESKFPNFDAVIKPWTASIWGTGFSDYVNKTYTWVDRRNFGWVHRQNDLLSLGEFIGPIALMFVVWFIINSFRQIGIQPALIAFMAVVLICSFQLTMFDPGEAGVMLMIGTLALTEGIKRRFM